MTTPGPGSLPRRALIDSTSQQSSVPSGNSDDWLRQLDWRQFEHLVGTAFRLQGYVVEPTADGADGGVDLILTRGGERIFVQCKHWRAYQVGVKTVRELLGVVVAHGATAGIVVTSGNYTAEAIEFGRQGSITLLDGRALNELLAIGRVSPGEAPPADQAGTTATAAAANAVGGAGGVPNCPFCQAPMVLRKAKRGQRAGTSFWGCSRYPGCKGLRNVSAPVQPASPQTTFNPTGAGRKALQALVSLGFGALALILILALLPILFRNLAAGIVTPRRLAPSSAVTATDPAAPVGEQPMDLAFDPRHGRLYSANYVSGDISVIDPASMSVIRTIDVPGKPTGVAIDPGNQRVFVSDYAGKVHVVDGKSGEVMASISVGGKPAEVALDSTRHRLFVASTANETVEVFDTKTNKRVRTLRLTSEPNAIAVDTDDGSLFVGVSFMTWRYQNPTSANQESPEYISSNGSDLAVDSGRQRLYAVHNALIVVRNLTTGASTTVDGVDKAATICLDEASRTAYLADPDTNRIWSVPLP